MRALTLPGRAGAAPAPVSHFEFWPDWLFYAPIVAQWLWLGLRHGDMSLPTIANPRLELGGLCGESKSAILDLVAPAERAALAAYVRVPVTGVDDAARAEAAMARAGLAYPLIAKPDVGCNGAGVRLVRDGAGLADYLAAFPTGADMVLQRYIPGPGEAGIFYIRHPDEPVGRITSLTLKQAPVVVGDGRSTLAQLMRADPRAGRVPELYLKALGARRDHVPAAGERATLVMVGNHCKGAIFTDGIEHATAALTRRIEQLARALPEFHFGRFDVRFGSVAELRRGEGLSVIEINGVGSEATHVWDARARLLPAWRDQLAHYRAAFEIAQAHRARGHRPAGVRAMWRHWRRQRQLMAAYPAHD